MTEFDAATHDRIIAATLVEDIVAWRIAPGAWIREREMTERFGVSRAPVREAFRHIAQIGLIRIVPWRGAQVIEVEQHAADEVFELWKSNFGVVCGLAAAAMSDEDGRTLLDRLQGYKDLVERTDNAFEHLDCSNRIGAFIARRCGGQTATDVLNRVALFARWQLHVISPEHFSREAGRRSAELFDDLCHKIVARDPEAADRAANALLGHLQDKFSVPLAFYLAQRRDAPARSERKQKETELMDATRRELLVGAGIAAGSLPTVAFAGLPQQLVQADLDRFVGFGVKASGGTGDIACGRWLAAELAAAGFKVEHQVFDVPWFDCAQATLAVEGATASVVPQAIVVPTSAKGLRGPLVRVEPASVAVQPVRGAIALIDLPYSRWSTAFAKPVHDTVRATLDAGAIAAILITNGPTRKAVALNADGVKPMFERPVAILAPDQAAPFIVAAAAQQEAFLLMAGTGRSRPAFNLIGRLDRGKRRWVVVSTPRSGWFTCAGERGPGIATWLNLARWAHRALPDHDLAFVCNSGHEYENLGSAKLLSGAAPGPDQTDLWLHLGANVAARDWHELGGGVLLPLSGADTQRFLVASPALLETARRAFTGLPGLADPYPSGQGSAGELTNILGAGYRSVVGIFGAHRFHHVAEDDRRCVDAALVAPVIAACKTLIKKATS